MNLVIDATLVMLVCFVLGALMAWLLAMAMYPTRTDLRAQAREQSPDGDDGERGDDGDDGDDGERGEDEPRGRVAPEDRADVVNGARR